MRFLDVAVVVHQQIRAVAVQNPRLAAGNPGGVLAALDSIPCRFHAVNLDCALIKKRIQQPHRDRTAADAQAIERIGKRPKSSSIRSRVSRPDDRLEVAYHGRIRMRTGNSADAIECIGDVANPIAYRFVHMVLKRTRAGFYRRAFGAKNFHSQHVFLLPLNIRPRTMQGRPNFAHSVAVAMPRGAHACLFRR